MDTPRIKVGYFQSHCVVDETGRASNLEKALARGLPTCTKQAERADRLAIVASGPSVRGYLEEIRDWPGEVWAINGAYRYLLENDIVPDGFFGMDPLPGLAEYVMGARRATAFYIASICDPSVFDNLEGYDVRIWHPEAEGMVYPKGSYVIGGGTTAITRAPFLGHLLGFRDITLYGADSSFNGSIYCYPHGTFAEDLQQPVLNIEIEGEVFQTELGLLKQATALGIIVPNFKGMLRVRSEGLIKAFLAAPTYSDECLEYVDV